MELPSCSGTLAYEEALRRLRADRDCVRGQRCISAFDERGRAAAKAQRERDQYVVAFKSSVLTALEDVENALVSLAKERQRSGQLATAASSYREAARLSRELYRAGSADFLDVLDAERSAFEAEDALLQSRASAATDYVALNKALGGGWDRPVDASKPEVVDVATGLRLAARR